MDREIAWTKARIERLKETRTSSFAYAVEIKFDIDVLETILTVLEDAHRAFSVAPAAAVRS